jgi:hypothetical protein
VRRGLRVFAMLNVLTLIHMCSIVPIRNLVSVRCIVSMRGMSSLLMIHLPARRGFIQRLVLQALFMAGMLWMIAHLSSPADCLCE